MARRTVDRKLRAVLSQRVCNPPELLDPADESLDRTALPACLAVRPALLVPVGLRRNDRGRSGRRNHVEDGVAVAIPVADHRLVRPEPLEERPSLRAVGRLSGGREHGLASALPSMPVRTFAVLPPRLNPTSGGSPSRGAPAPCLWTRIDEESTMRRRSSPPPPPPSLSSPSASS